MKACKTARLGWMVMAAAVAAAAGLLWAAEGEEAPATEPQASWANYSFITQRNIFSRNRGRRAERRTPEDTSEAPARAVLAAESYMVLKGIVAAGQTFAAFIEDTRTNEVFRVGAGGTIASGAVSKLTLDSVVYKQGDKEFTILVGQTLSGASGQTVLTFDNLMQWSTTQPSAAGGSSSATTSGGGAATPSPASEDEAETMRKLLERRKQELGG